MKKIAYIVIALMVIASFTLAGCKQELRWAPKRTHSSGLLFPLAKQTRFWLALKMLPPFSMMRPVSSLNPSSPPNMLA